MNVFLQVPYAGFIGLIRIPMFENIDCEDQFGVHIKIKVFGVISPVVITYFNGFWPLKLQFKNPAFPVLIIQQVIIEGQLVVHGFQMWNQLLSKNSLEVVSFLTVLF